MQDKITQFCINKHNLVIFTSVMFVPLHFISFFFSFCLFNFLAIQLSLEQLEGFWL